MENSNDALRRLTGVVIELPVFERAGREPKKDREGKEIRKLYIRRVYKNNKGDDRVEDYSLSSDPPVTTGLARFIPSQAVSFLREGRVACEVMRIPLKENPEWTYYTKQSQFPSVNGNCQWREAEVVSYNPQRGFGFVLLRSNGQKVFFSAAAVVKRDEGDIVGFFPGDEVDVYLRPQPVNGDSGKKGKDLCPAANHVISLEY